MTDWASVAEAKRAIGPAVGSVVRFFETRQ
jgi:hypothetical protein